MDKVLQLILKLKSKPEADWKPSLEGINILDDITPLYEVYSAYHANVILGVLVLYYHKDSQFLEAHTDPIDNKMKILRAIGGESALADEVFFDAIHNGHSGAVDLVTEWIIDYQRDKRWKEIFTCWTYASKVMRMAQTINDTDAKRAREIGQALSVAFEMRSRGDKLYSDIQNEFMHMDTMLEREGRKKITERTGPMGSWEEHLAAARAKKQQ